MHGWLHGRRWAVASALAAVAWVASAGPAAAQIGGDDPVTVSVSGPATAVAPGGSGEIGVRLEIGAGYHIYGPEYPATPTVVRVTDAPGIAFGSPRYPAAHVTERFGEKVPEYAGAIVVVVPFTVARDAAAGVRPIRIVLDYQVCDEKSCLDPVEGREARAEITVATGGAVTAPVAPGTTVATPPTGPGTTGPAGPGPGPTPRTTPAATDRLDDLSLVPFLLTCIVAGAFSLVMPCVYPLIPITVTFFVKQAGEHGQARTMLLATVYALGIVSSFTALGLVLSVTLGATGANDFAANPWVNVVISVIFGYLTLALFGLVPLELPSFITSSLAGGAPRKGVFGAFLLGLIFTVVTFTCVVPVAGALLALAASGGFWKAALGMFVYSSTMALPFLALGFFPVLIRRMPAGGGWMHTVKVTAGFVELALVVYYFTKADFGFHTVETLWVSRDLALALYTAAGGFAATYLLGWWRLPDDEGTTIGVGRMLIAFVFGTATLFLAAGLAGRDLGVLEAMLPLPAEGARTPGGDARPTPTEFSELEPGLVAARAAGKPVFVEFTGFS